MSWPGVYRGVSMSEEKELEFRRLLAKIRIINERLNKLRQDIEELQTEINELTDMIVAGRAWVE